MLAVVVVLVDVVGLAVKLIMASSSLSALISAIRWAFEDVLQLDASCALLIAKRLVFKQSCFCCCCCFLHYQAAAKELTTQTF